MLLLRSQNQWLNDEVINYYLQLLQQLSHRPPPPGAAAERPSPRLFCHSTFFWPRLVGADGSGYDYSGVQRWTRKFPQLFEQVDLLLIPVNLAHHHWALACCDLRARPIELVRILFTALLIGHSGLATLDWQAWWVHECNSRTDIVVLVGVPRLQ